MDIKYFSFKNKFEKSEVIVLSVTIFIIAVILCYRITEPWNGWFDFNGAAYSRFAKNFLTFGFLRTKFTPTWDLGNIVPEKFNYYLHHPPLLAYIVATSYKIFGFHEWAARLISIIFSLMAVNLFYLLARSLWNRTLAFFSLVFFGFSPAFLYYGRMVNHEPVFLFFYFLIIYFYLRFLDERKNIYILGLIISFILAYLTAWPAFYLSVILLIHYLICGYKNTKDRRPIVILGLMPILFALFYICWIYFIKGSLSDNINSIISRFGPNQVHQFNWKEFLLLEINRIKILFTKISYISIPLYITYLLLRKNREGFLKETVDIIFLSLAMINIFLFREGAWEHDYQLYYFLPLFAIIAAKGLLLLKRYLRTKIIFQIFVTSFIIIFLASSYPNFMSIQSFRFDIDRSIADKINSLTRPDEEIGTNFQISVPTSWYVDRKYTIINSIEELQKINAERKLSFIILIPREDKHDLIRYLNEKYSSFIYEHLIFYNLKEHL